MPTKIAIIGAGPSGLTLARLLQHSGIPVSVYEAETSRASRDQGGTLDLHPNGGQAALQAAGLLAQFEAASRPDAECLKLLDQAGNVLWDENLLPGGRPVEFRGRPEIDRTVLREILLDSLEEGTVQWGCRVKVVEEGVDGRLRIVFEGGKVVEDVDLVVGADGAFSKVRPLVTDVVPHYASVTAVALEKADVDVRAPWLAKQIGAGSCFAAGQDWAVQCQRLGNGDVRVYACLRVDKGWLEGTGVDWDDAPAARKWLTEHAFSHCGEDIKRMILEADDTLAARRLYMLPVGLRWESKSHVTVLGDAAHVMTPFAGVGVNVAMTDSLVLFKSLMAHRTNQETIEIDVAAAIKEYETEMFTRAESFTSRTWNGLQERFSEGSMERWAKKNNGHLDQLRKAGKMPAA